MKTLSGYKALWTPGEGCVWEADQPVWSLLRMNAHYVQQMGDRIRWGLVWDVETG